MVVSRPASSSIATRASSASRPTKLDTSARRLVWRTGVPGAAPGRCRGAAARCMRLHLGARVGAQLVGQPVAQRLVGGQGVGGAAGGGQRRSSAGRRTVRAVGGRRPAPRARRSCRRPRPTAGRRRSGRPARPAAFLSQRASSATVYAASSASTSGSAAPQRERLDQRCLGAEGITGAQPRPAGGGQRDEGDRVHVAGRRRPAGSRSAPAGSAAGSPRPRRSRETRDCSELVTSCGGSSGQTASTSSAEDTGRPASTASRVSSRRSRAPGDRDDPVAPSRTSSGPRMPICTQPLCQTASARTADETMMTRAVTSVPRHKSASDPGCETGSGRRVSARPGRWPGASGSTEYSRNAACRACSPSRKAAACGPRSGADALTSPASAVISVRAWSRSRCAGLVGIGFGQPELLGGGGHQHHRRAADHLDRGDVHQVTGASGASRSRS